MFAVTDYIFGGVLGMYLISAYFDENTNKNIETSAIKSCR